MRWTSQKSKKCWSPVIYATHATEGCFQIGTPQTCHRVTVHDSRSRAEREISRCWKKKRRRAAVVGGGGNPGTNGMQIAESSRCAAVMIHSIQCHATVDGWLISNTVCNRKQDASLRMCCLWYSRLRSRVWHRRAEWMDRWKSKREASVSGMWLQMARGHFAHAKECISFCT